MCSATAPVKARRTKPLTHKDVIALLTARVTELETELGRERGWNELLENELDALRACLGMREVPL